MRTRTLDDSTAATNEGSLRISRAEYARYNGKTFPGRCYLYFNSFLPIWFKPKMRFGGFRWQRFSERFMFGDTNPVVVLDAKAGLVASFTDLDARLQKRFPVVKIFVEKLHLLATPAKAGDTFAAVSLYAGDSRTEELGRWGNFYPMVVDCVTQDPSRCASTKAKISDREWKALDFGLSQLPDKTQPGVYDIALPDDLRAAL